MEKENESCRILADLYRESNTRLRSEERRSYFFYALYCLEAKEPKTMKELDEYFSKLDRMLPNSRYDDTESRIRDAMQGVLVPF